jgi:hypothetical protein
MNNTIKCDDCHKVFTRNSGLKNHKEIYNGCCKFLPKKEYLCYTCKKLYSRIDKLNAHLKVCIKKHPEINDFTGNFQLFLQHVTPPNISKLRDGIITPNSFYSLFITPNVFIRHRFRDQYIKNIPSYNRSIWILDRSRYKYYIRHNNEWEKCDCSIFPTRDDIRNINSSKHIGVNLIWDYFGLPLLLQIKEFGKNMLIAHQELFIEKKKNYDASAYHSFLYEHRIKFLTSDFPTRINDIYDKINLYHILHTISAQELFKTYNPTYVSLLIS